MVHGGKSLIDKVQVVIGFQKFWLQEQIFVQRQSGGDSFDLKFEKGALCNADRIGSIPPPDDQLCDERVVMR